MKDDISELIDEDIRQLQEMISKDMQPSMGGKNKINHSKALKILSDLYNQSRYT